ncbi:MAG: TonB-dependent receptor [Terriglobales bacterium]
MTYVRLQRMAVFVLALLLPSALGFAQTPPARSTAVTIVVIDDKNAPLAGATVETQTGTAAAASMATHADGKATLAVPAASTISVTVSKPGYLTNQTSITALAEPQTIDVVLTPAGLSKQEVNVSASAESPTEESSAGTQTISGAKAKQAPGRPATLKDALPLVPGVTKAPDGSVQISGAGESHSALLVNAVNVTDPATGEFGIGVPIDSVDKVSVTETPYLAEYGRFTAGVVSAETRRGGDKWIWSLNDPLPDFRIHGPRLNGIRDAAPRLNFSGPIIANKLYFLEGSEYLLDKHEVYTLPYPNNVTRSQAFNSFSQLDWIVSPTQTLTFSYHLAPHSLSNAGLNFFNPTNVTPNVNLHESTGTVIDRLQIGGGVLDSTFAMTRYSGSVDPHAAGDMIVAPTGNSGNYFSQQSRLSTRFQWIENYQPRRFHFLGDHILQFGTEVAHAENDGAFNAHPVLINDAAGALVQRIDFTGGSRYAVSDLEPAAYAQDHWLVTPHLALDFGARLEGQTITSTTRVAPRFGFAFNPARSSKTTFRGGIGVFYQSVPLDVYAFDSYPQRTVTTFGANGLPVGLPVPYLNLTSQAAVAGFPFIDREAKIGNFAPFSVAGDIEIDQSINRLLSVRFKYLQSLARDQVTLSPETLQGQSAIVLGSSGEARTREFEFTSRIGPDSRRQLYFSYVRQSAKGNINDAAAYLANLPFPVVRNNLSASLPGELPNRFLLWGTYSLPKQFTVIPKVEVRNGFPYQSTNVFQQFVGMTGAQSRFPRYFSLDLRVSKDIKIGKKHAIRISGTVLNLTNHFNPLEVHSNIADPAYGTFFGNYNRKVYMDFDFLY